MALLIIDWLDVLQRLGVPLTVALAVTFASYKVVTKAVWPYFKQRLERADQQTDLARQVVADQLQKAETRIEKADRIHETLLSDFRGAIEENNRVSRRVAESLDELLRRKN